MGRGFVEVQDTAQVEEAVHLVQTQNTLGCSPLYLQA